MDRLAAAASPKLTSPRTKKMAPDRGTTPDPAGVNKSQLSRLFDAGAEDMSPFRVLYNLEVLSGRLMPTATARPTSASESSMQFSQDFLQSDGLRHILAVFERDSLPLDTDYDTRQRIYLIALQVGHYTQTCKDLFLQIKNFVQAFVYFRLLARIL